MATFILACAFLLANVTGFAGLSKAIAEGIGSYNLSPVALLLMLTLFILFPNLVTYLPSKMLSRCP